MVARGFALLFVATAAASVVYIAEQHRFMNERLEIVERLAEDNELGHRKDPFRCTDAREYFNKIGIHVDCERIEATVNGTE